MKKLKLAVVGASGLVGQTILSVLGEEGLLDKVSLSLFVSDKSAGRVVQLGGEEFRLIELSPSSAEQQFDVAIFSAGDEVSRQYAPIFASFGTFVIDNTNAFRREQNVPLVVPEINGEKIFCGSRIISNPNCSTIQLVVVLDILRKISEIKRVVVSTYQSVSGAGKDALDDLENGTCNIICEGINQNVVAHIGAFAPHENCVEEDKIIFETNKILNSNIEVCATSVRIPIGYCHSESVYVEFESEVSALDAERLIASKNYLELSSDSVFLPKDCKGSNKTFVCRMRNYGKNALAFFVVADNLRRGAAYNAVLIARELINKLQNQQ